MHQNHLPWLNQDVNVNYNYHEANLGERVRFSINTHKYKTTVGRMPKVLNMVKRPRQVKRYSPSAGKHTVHTVERVKKKRASELRWGQRRFRKVMAGYRGFPRPRPEGREKPTKRVNILYRCTETGKAHYAPCKRAKKFELVDK